MTRFLLFIFLFFARFSWAQVCIGDSLQSAIVINNTSVTMTGNSDTSCFSNQIGNPANDVFYQVVLHGCAQAINVQACGTYDVFLHILDAGGNSLASDDNGGMALCGPLSSAYLHLVANGGDTLYIVVEGANAEAGTYTLFVSQDLAAPVSADFYYADSNFCIANANPQTPTITGDAGGVFSIYPPASLSLDSVTGMFFPEMEGDYTITYSVDSGLCTVSQTFPVRVGLPWAADFSYSQDSFCANTQPLPLPTLLQQGGIFSSASGLQLDSLTGELHLDNSQVGTHSIQYTIAAPCPASQQINIEVLEADIAEFYYYRDDMGTGQPDSFFWNCSSYTPVILGDTAAYFYAINDEGNLNLDPATGIISPSSAVWDEFSVVYVTGGECSAADTFHFVKADCESTTTIENSDAYSVFPNPNQGKFTIKNQGKETTAQIQIFDILGKVVYNKKAVFLAKNDLYSIELTALPKGIYTLLISDKEKAASYKLLDY